MTREERHALALVVDAVAEQAHLQGWADDGRYPMQLLAASVLTEGARGLLACHGPAIDLVMLETLADRLTRGHWMAATARVDGSGYALPLDSFPGIHLSNADAVAQVRRNAPYFSHGFVVTAGHAEQIFPESALTVNHNTEHPAGGAVRTLNAYAGPAGWEEGARILGLADGILGVEIDELTCTTAITAGHQRLQADIRTVNPADYLDVTGFFCSSPCTTLSAAGKRVGLGDDCQVVLDVITCAGSDCDCSWEEIETELEGLVNERTGLAAQTIRFALQLPALEWLAFEQVPGVEYMWEDIAAELTSNGWKSADVMTLDAKDFGLPVRRKRTFLVAHRARPLGGRGVDHPRIPAAFPARTMAEVLGWEPGHQIRARGARSGGGGNLFSCDGPSWCLTEKARTWEREADGLRLTVTEAGLLQGFRPDYPWHGSRTRQFRQAADVVCPPVAAAVLGCVTGTPWVGPVRKYLAELFEPTQHAVAGLPDGKPDAAPKTITAYLAVAADRGSNVYLPGVNCRDCDPTTEPACHASMRIGTYGTQWTPGTSTARPVPAWWP